MTARHDAGRRRGVYEMAAAMTISGTIGWFVLKSGATPGQVVFWRCLFGGAVLAATCAVQGIRPWALTRREAILSLGSGVAIVANWLLLFGAFPKVGIAVATIVYNTQPFLLVFLGRVFLGERLSIAMVGWLGMAFVGLLLIVWMGLIKGNAGDHYVLGTLMALGAALCWAAAAVQTKLLSGTPPQTIALVHTMVGIVLLAPTGLSHTGAVSASGWAMLATIGVVHTGLVYILMYDAIHRLPTSLQGALSYLYPAVAVLVDIVAFDRIMTPIEAAGMAAILCAATGVTGIQGELWQRAIRRWGGHGRLGQ